MPKISILIPSYNSSKYLADAINSALNQTFHDFEIIVIDDGSTDNTAELVRNISNQHPNKLRYIHQENKGLAIARNTGIKASQGEYLALLDADDQWLPEHLEESIEILDKDKSIGVVHANINYIDPLNQFLSTPKREIQFLSGYIFENIFLRKVNIACPTVLFRKSCCEEVGYFDEKLTRLGCEDRDLWLRIAQKYKFFYIDKVISNYRITPQSMSQNSKKMLEARLYVVDKFCPAEDLNKRPLRNKALSKIYRDRGDEFLLKGDYDDAKKEYIKSIGYYPFAFWAWLNWTKSLLKLGKAHVRTI